MKSLPVSEYFFSIQGEGPSQGVPSVFLRLSGCNLKCGSNEHSTWTCDSLDVLNSFRMIEFSDLIREWTAQGWMDYLVDNAHLVITGGEPLLYQKQLLDFLQELPKCFVEVETNGTIMLNSSFDMYVNQYNISPKLTNSGEMKEKRINPLFLEWFPRNVNEVEKKANFKFVVTSEDDWDEIMKDFILPFDIPRKMIWLMAGASSKDELSIKNKMVAELAIRECVNFSNRIQVQIWDKTTGC